MHCLPEPRLNISSGWATPLDVLHLELSSITQLHLSRLIHPPKSKYPACLLGILQINVKDNIAASICFLYLSTCARWHNILPFLCGKSFIYVTNYDNNDGFLLTDTCARHSLALARKQTATCTPTAIKEQTFDFPVDFRFWAKFSTKKNISAQSRAGPPKHGVACDITACSRRLRTGFEQRLRKMNKITKRRRNGKGSSMRPLHRF